MPLLHTPRLELLPATAADLRADLAGQEALARSLGVAVPPSWPPPLYDAPAIQWSLDHLAAHPDDADWCLSYIVRVEGGRARHVVGAGGFKGAPDADGAVEIGYSLVPEQQGNGYATEAALGWVGFAFANPRVSRVIAHTLRSLGPSIRVLERAGFACAGEAEDPGAPPGETVIRYELLRPADRARP